MGNGRPFYWGDKLNGTEANINGNYPYGTTTKGKYLKRTCAVDFTNEGKYPKHPCGLMHMHGNVWEWCENLYDQTNSRVLRGGAWSRDRDRCRAAFRYSDAPAGRNRYYGFRVCFRLD